MLRLHAEAQLATGLMHYGLRCKLRWRQLSYQLGQQSEDLTLKEVLLEGYAGVVSSALSTNACSTSYARHRSRLRKRGRGVKLMRRLRLGMRKGLGLEVMGEGLRQKRLLPSLLPVLGRKALMVLVTGPRAQQAQ